MKDPEPHNIFNLESLEPRIMLSGDPLLGAVDFSAPDEQEDLFKNDSEAPAAEEIFLTQESQTSEKFPADSDQYQPSNSLEDIFAGCEIVIFLNLFSLGSANSAITLNRDHVSVSENPSFFNCFLYFFHRLSFLLIYSGFFVLHLEFMRSPLSNLYGLRQRSQYLKMNLSLPGILQFLVPPL